MWPYLSSTSRIIESPAQPKISVDLDAFGENSKEIDAALSQDIWDVVGWLSVKTDTSRIDVLRALLFQALYGRIAYEMLVEHVRQQKIHQNQAPVMETDVATNVKFSRTRSTTVDVAYVGKSSVRRKLAIPHRMWVDIDRQAAKAQVDVPVYVRRLLFKVLHGEVNYQQWQRAQAEYDDRSMPPSAE